jgi:hypothetical protein
MGWKTFFAIGQKEFRNNWIMYRKWGSLDPYKINVSGVDYYGAGIIASPQELQSIYGESPKIEHPAGAKTRITVKFIHHADAGEPSTAASQMFICFYTNGDTAKDDDGKDLHGFHIMLNSTPSQNIDELRTFVVEQENNTITTYLDGQKLGTYKLNGELRRFSLFVVSTRYRVESAGEASAEQPSQASAEKLAQDAHGIVIYEVKAEVYDFLEDMFGMINQVIYLMVPLMIVPMVLNFIVPKSKSKKRD